MWDLKKRGKGKHSNSLTIRDMYKAYRKEKKANKVKYATYKEFSNIIKLANKKISDYIINDSDIFYMPYRIGEIQIIKTLKSFNAKENRLAIDYKKTKENGFVTFHEDKYIYKWNWNKNTSKLKGSSWFKFEASRTNKRSVPIALSNNIDYFGV